MSSDIPCTYHSSLAESAVQLMQVETLSHHDPPTADAATISKQTHATVLKHKAVFEALRWTSSRQAPRS